MREWKEQGLHPGLEPGGGVGERGRGVWGGVLAAQHLPGLWGGGSGAGVAEVGSNPDGGICAVLGRKPRCAKQLSVC